MSEHLQTRTEHSRSLEDAERFKALETLKELGFLIPLTDVDSYHGRLAYEGDSEWEVDPAFKNGGNDSGNRNLNGRATLYTSSEETAGDFAQARGMQVINGRVREHFDKIVDNYTDEQKQAWADRENAKHREEFLITADDGRVISEPKRVFTADDFNAFREAHLLKKSMPADEYLTLQQSFAAGMKKQIHDIVALDTDASVINEKFDVTKLDKDDKIRCQKALQALSINVTAGAPVAFDDRTSLEAIMASANKRGQGWFSYTDVAAIAEESGASIDATTGLLGASNARILSLNGPTFLTRKLLESHNDIIEVNSKDTDGNPIHMPVSMDYIENWLRENHIVGVQQSIDSATLGKRLTSISLFDLNKAMTKETLDKRLQKVQRTMGAIASSFEGAVEGDKPLLHLLEDAHAKPQAMVDAAREVEGFKEIYDMDTGNWEKFTLAEHTETVLDNFEKNFADELPVAMLAPMRLIVLAHDIGKPIAAQNGNIRNQTAYNVKYAAEFYKKLGIDGKLSNLMLKVIGSGATLAFKMDIKADPDAPAQLDELADKTLTDFYGQAPTEQQKQGFIEMCRILQIADGGAYTTMAVTRSRQGPGRYRNAPSFQSSFAEPTGLGKRDIKLKR